MVRDPVCKMFVNPEDTDKIIYHKDSKYFFCSTFCKELFENNANKYLADKINQQQKSIKPIKTFLFDNGKI